MTTSSDSAPDLSTLDALTAGALTAPTSGERAARLRDWLATEPSPELMQQVLKEMSTRDKGAAKPLREKLDDLKRAKAQDLLAQEWSDKAEALLQAAQFKVADAMAWQRDAAKAGAPLSREPLAGLRHALTERIKHVDELEHRAQVQRETALLLTQRIEVLSTKAWQEALEQQTALQADLKRLHDEFSALQNDAHWSSVDPKYPALVAETTQHMPLVWEAFSAALAQTQAAAEDGTLALPAVPAWADQLRQARGEVIAAVPSTTVHKPKAEAPQAAQVALQVPALLQQLEKEVALGHSKAMSAAAAQLRATLKTKGLRLEAALAEQVQTALAAAGELEGWQRKHADEIRLQLVVKAEALLQAPTPQPQEQDSTQAVEHSQWVPTMGGANCKTPCVSCATNGKKPTKVVCPTMVCGNALTKPVTEPTPLCKLGLRRPRQKVLRTVKGAWLCWLKWLHGRRPIKAIQIGKAKPVNCISFLSAGVTAAT